LIPEILAALNEDDEDNIQAVFSTFNTLVELKGLLSPHLEKLIELSINLASSETFTLAIREQALYFLEQLPMNYAKTLKQHPVAIQTILQTLLTIASESEEGYEESTDNPSSLSLIAARSYAYHMKNKLVYPMFADLIQNSLVSENGL
jgi:hypothetical protein